MTAGDRAGARAALDALPPEEQRSVLLKLANIAHDRGDEALAASLRQQFFDATMDDPGDLDWISDTQIGSMMHRGAVDAAWALMQKLQRFDADTAVHRHVEFEAAFSSSGDRVREREAHEGLVDALAAVRPASRRARGWAEYALKLIERGQVWPAQKALLKSRALLLVGPRDAQAAIARILRARAVAALGDAAKARSELLAIDGQWPAEPARWHNDDPRFHWLVAACELGMFDAVLACIGQASDSNDRRGRILVALEAPLRAARLHELLQLLALLAKDGDPLEETLAILLRLPLVADERSLEAALGDLRATENPDYLARRTEAGWGIVARNGEWRVPPRYAEIGEVREVEIDYESLVITLSNEVRWVAAVREVEAGPWGGVTLNVRPGELVMNCVCKDCAEVFSQLEAAVV
jgi:predicted nucleic acid-binding protein